MKAVLFIFMLCLSFSSLEVRAESYNGESDVFAILEKSKTIKSEAIQEMKRIYKGREEDLVGLNDVMDSFEVNELVAEIIEAEAY